MISHFKHIARTLGIFGVIAVASGCGGGGSSDGGGDPALGCVEQAEAGPSTINVTNTCDRTIIVLVEGGRRFVIAAGDTNRIDMIGFGTRIAACFSPSEPEFDGGSFFLCN